MPLNKFVAHSGLCSRRKAVEYIKDGLIKLNGEVETNPAVRVSEKDRVEYKGKKLRLEKKKVYILMNKPKNTVTTLNDERGRKTVMEIVENKIKQRIYPVGRLDRNTTGLLLLTNDGDLAKKLSHPSFEVEKIYHAILDKPLKPSDLDLISRGLELEDGLAPVDHIQYNGKSKNEVIIRVHIGRNRIIRRIFAYLGYTVEKLDRIYYAGLSKKDLPRGWFRNLKPEEVRNLKFFTGNK